jgi:L-threonylcarbamoyladenylate synthase
VKDVLEYFDGKIDCVIDGGICALGVESTIVDLSSGSYKIIRQGALPEDDIWRVIGLGDNGVVY